MKAKSKKWAAESLESETEKKQPLTKKQKQKASELTAGMLAGAVAGPIVGTLVKGLLKTPKVKVIPPKKGKPKRVAPPKSKLKAGFKGRMQGPKVKQSKPSPLRIFATDENISRVIDQEDIPVKGNGKDSVKKLSDEKFVELYKEKHPYYKNKKAKGGPVKKYAKGGGVRAARF